MSGETSFIVSDAALIFTDDLVLAAGLVRSQPVRGLNHCADGKDPLAVRCDCNVIQRHALKFVRIQRLGLDKLDERSRGPRNATYSTVNIL